LRRAVSYANFGKLRFKTEEEQQVWNECCRLLTNCIIYYNASILSRLLTSKEAAGDTAGVELLTQVSPVAWQHINFYGRYEFTKVPAPISLECDCGVLNGAATRDNRGRILMYFFGGYAKPPKWVYPIESSLTLPLIVTQ
jgi:hypothetical protein